MRDTELPFTFSKRWWVPGWLWRMVAEPDWVSEWMARPIPPVEAYLDDFLKYGGAPAWALDEISVNKEKIAAELRAGRTYRFPAPDGKTAEFSKNNFVAAYGKPWMSVSLASDA